MWATLVVGLLFLAGAAYNVFGPEPNHPEALAGTGIAAVLVGVFFLARFHKQRAGEFEGWLIRNAGAIEQGGARYDDVLITRATVLTRYQAVLSFLVVTLKLPTRFYVVDHDPTALVAAVCTSISLVLGWWGIPWGPIYTAQVVARNVRGGFRQTVAERLSGLPSFMGPA